MAMDVFSPRSWVDRLARLAGGRRQPSRDGAVLEAAVALARSSSEGRLEPAMHVVVEAAGRATGADAVLVLVDGEGRPPRCAAANAEASVRDALLAADVLTALLGRLRALNRPVRVEDLEGPARASLAAVAPHGILAFPVNGGGSGALVLLEPPGSHGLDEEAIVAGGMLALLAGGALAGARRLAGLRDTRESLRRLAVRILERRDAELRRVAHFLHEGVGQRLAAAKAQLEAFDPLLEVRPEAARACMRESRALVEQTLGELRELAQGLHPSVLEDFGYVPALRWYVERLQERTHALLSLEVEGGEARLPLDLEGALYRATEAALGSVVEGEVRVRYRRDPTAVHLEIAGGRPERLSLAAIREQLRPFGGAVRVRSVPPAPAVVAFDLPAPVA